ncbi:MAG: hypothetical protein KF773_43125 [Deltaproteobacteria bacterium]|nr:hypothetical protein [Deltaproteobacteria bacterium]
MARTLVCLAALAAFTAPAAAQGWAPVLCFQDATDKIHTSDFTALQLCVGATSEAPAQCFARATREAYLTDDVAVDLCRMASSTEPAQCVINLRTTTSIGDPTNASFCAAVRYPITPPDTGGSAACLQAALAQPEMTEQRGLQLCQGSASTSPVECYRLGRDRLNVDDNTLVQLCAPVVVIPTY